MQRPMKRSRLLAAGITLLLISSLVGSVFVMQQARAQDESPVGQWTVALTRADVPEDVAGGFSYVGRWRLGIESDGTYDAQRSDVGVAVTGTWTVDGDQITFTDDEGGLLSCANGAAAPIITDSMTSGIYTWESVLHVRLLPLHRM
jgi:hypothetical protein